MTHLVPGRRAVIEALRANRAIEELLLDRARPDEDVAELARARGLRVVPVERATLDDLTDGVVHQGMVARTPPFRYRHLSELEGDRVVVLDNVTDPQNLGAVARSAEASGSSGLVIPKRRSAAITPAVERAAAGALSWLPVARVPNLPRALADLAERGLWSVGLDGTAATSIWELTLFDADVALVVGAEGRGLSRLVAERCDALAAIPLSGRVGSLNASAAAAVALFELARRRHPG